MHGKLRLTGFLFFLMQWHYVTAQLTMSFSDYFDQFYNNYYLLNTANTDTTYKIDATASSKTQTGLFQGVNKIYIDIDLRLSSKKENFHFAGIQAINNREGDFISKNRLIGRYSLRIPLSYRSALSAGISGGFVNYAFNTSQSGVGGADWVPDANAGIWYLREKISVGFSTQQLFNQKIRPANQTFSLGRYYNMTIKSHLPVNSFLKYNTHFYARFQKDQPFYFVCASLFELQERFDMGASYAYRRGLSFVTGFKNLAIANSRFSFYFSYLIGVNKISVNDNAFELLVSYHK